MARVGVNLSGRKLEYHFAKKAGFEMIGSEDGPFAILDCDRKTIFMFGEPNIVEQALFNTDCANVPLELAKEFGASFRVEDSNVVCEINGISCEGANYMEAAMKTLLLQFIEEETHQRICFKGHLCLCADGLQQCARRLPRRMQWWCAVR